MGRTADESVQTNPSNDGGSVKKSELVKFYEQGHSPQEVADEYNVEVSVVMDVLGLNDVHEAEPEEPADDAPTE